jgi:hypothetical protein
MHTTDDVAAELQDAPGLERPERAPVQSGKSSAKPEGTSAVRHPGRKFTVPRPVYRTLRGFALDPSLAQQLDTAPISQTVFTVPWERLSQGPVGEYLEVIDYDPAGKCFYAPVDLDDPFLLAQDGLPASEGTPQFHQQMVYAVARLTIDNFEHALGRCALWAPGPSPDPRQPKDDSNYVQRLRIYPHALREANAYYSPTKKALLFGYYPAGGDDPSDHIPGGMVFTCLSHDIIAHETTHALLDGLHRRLSQATNPDMLAFHEGFADIVALLQHFTFPDILRHQIRQTRGDLRSQENLLGQLATQFGRTTGARGALRDAIGTYNKETQRWEPHRRDPKEYEQTFEPHARGAILVGAVFDAFLSIYSSRVADLIRLATSGTGVLSPGAIHPDLVNRLAEEAAKSASHVLTMCVRALDYCPPVDLTFGEYLRAIITADSEIVPDDDRHYRLALVEAFRRRGIYPRDVRSLSEESLRWRTPTEDEFQPSNRLVDVVKRMRQQAERQLYARTRRGTFRRERQTRGKIHDMLKEALQHPKTGPQDAAFLGLDAAESFEVHAAHFAARTGPDGDFLFQLILQLTQDSDVPAEGKQPAMHIEGGCTVVADLKSPRIAYCIRKPLGSMTRVARQREFLNRLAEESSRAVYLGTLLPRNAVEPFALLHRVPAENSYAS